MLRFDADTHTYWFNDQKVPSVTGILNAVTDFSGIHPDVLRHAADRGTAVHYGCELYDNDDLDWDSLDEQLVPYIEAWAEFRAITGFKPDRIEHRVYHPGLRYAGTLDRDGIFQSNRSVIDIKTTTVMQPWVGLQLAAYMEGVHAGEPDAPKYTHRYSVQLKNDGRWKVHEYTNPADWSTFVALRTVVGWADKHQTRISYEPN